MRPWRACRIVLAIAALVACSPGGSSTGAGGGQTYGKGEAGRPTTSSGLLPSTSSTDGTVPPLGTSTTNGFGGGRTPVPSVQPTVATTASPPATTAPWPTFPGVNLSKGAQVAVSCLQNDSVPVSGAGCFEVVVSTNVPPPYRVFCEAAGGNAIARLAAWSVDGAGVRTPLGGETSTRCLWDRWGGLGGWYLRVEVDKDIAGYGTNVVKSLQY